MENYDWNWRKPKQIKTIKKVKGEKNELWNIWWTICTTRIKRKIN